MSELLPHHRELIVASAITDEVAGERGYWSATRPDELEPWFGPSQRGLVPALVVPVHDVRGEVTFCQLRPDQPREINGKALKYETPKGARMALDVPPRAQPVLGDPNVPLVFTEGARKADAAVSVGLFAVAVIGVWNWRGRNEHGGLTALADFELIALNGRVIYIAFDSDAMHKREVHTALMRLSAFLRKRGADVRFVYLLSGAGGAKTGLDDFLAAGHSKDDVLALATDELRSMANGAPPPKSAERTERARGNPVNTGVLAFGTGPNGDRTQTERSAPPGLANEERILDRFDATMGEQGLVGERHIARAAFLIHVSRLLKDPARAVVKGDSSTGKSYAVVCALKAAAPEFLWARTSTSPLALFYSEEDFRHRTLVVYEANKLADDDDDFARVLRTLLSEGKLQHEVTDVKTRSTVLLEKDGPVAFLSTIARASLDPEVETRILSLHSDGSDEMTANVVAGILRASADTAQEMDFSAWHELDRWLAGGPCDVIVPWGPALAEFNLSGPPRLRRDITNLLSLVRAHALLHRATRELDSRDRIVATLDDYEVARGLLADAMAIATDKAVRSGTREVVDAVAALRAEGKTPVSLKAVARQAGRSASTTHTDVHDALDRGYLINRSQRDRSFDLDAGDPMPGHEELLPSRADLEAQLGDDRSVGVRPPFGTRPNAKRPVNIEDSGVRSVRSADLGGEGHDDDPGGVCECIEWTARMGDDTCQKCGRVKR